MTTPDKERSGREEALRAASEKAGQALASLVAEMAGLQRQIDRMHEELSQSEERSTRLTDAKFVTYRTLIDSQADKVKLALEATEKAIDKAEIATSKAIEKESVANFDRFAKVNEFRAQQTELISRFATLERVDLIDDNLQARLGDMSLRLNELVVRLTKIEEYTRGAQGNKAGLYAAIGAAVGLIAIIAFIASILAR